VSSILVISDDTIPEPGRRSCRSDQATN